MSGIIHRTVAAVVTAAVFSTVGATAASAATTKPTTVAVNMTATSASARQQIANDLKSGDTITFTGASGQEFSAKLVDKRVAVSEVTPAGKVTPNYGPCTVAVSAGVMAIGAAALGVLAVTTDGVAIAGIWIAASELGQLAAIASSFAAVEAFVALYVC